MRASAWSLGAALALLVSAFVSADAADTGSASGAVFDRNGQPVAEAVVKISGASLPLGRVVLTGESGLFQFEYLSPGAYVVETDKAGTGSAKRTLVIEVGKDTQVDLVIGLSFQEQLTVSAAQPLVDVRSAEVGFNFQDETLNSLPLERTYRGLFQLIPGVADNRSPIGPAAGGSRQDNMYLVDGANITSPLFGYLSTEVNELDIAEVNLKRAGVNAEFGRTSGTVVNAVSRSGSNRLSGVARMDWLSTRLVDGYELPADLVNAGVKPGAFRDALLTSQAVPATGFGGPLVRDHLFFYGSARYSRETNYR
jgi:Carboxypeptidase regulatory-like domain